MCDRIASIENVEYHFLQLLRHPACRLSFGFGFGKQGGQNLALALAFGFDIDENSSANGRSLKLLSLNGG